MLLLSNLTLVSLGLPMSANRVLFDSKFRILTSLKVAEVFDARLLAEKPVALDGTHFTPLVGFVDEQSKMMGSSGALFAFMILVDIVCIVIFVMHVRPCCQEEDRSEVHAPIVPPL